MQQISQRQVFRAKALNSTFATDELDNMMQVTRPTGWLALLAIGIIIAAGFAWGIAGKLSIQVAADGLILDNASGSQQAVLFVPMARQKSIRPGMKVQMALAGLPPQRHGYLLGIVRTTGQYPLTSQNMAEILKNDNLEAVFKQDGPVSLVNVELQRNATKDYAWTGGRNAPVSSGTLIQAGIIVDEKRPIELLLPGRGE